MAKQNEQTFDSKHGVYVTKNIADYKFTGTAPKKAAADPNSSHVNNASTDPLSVDLKDSVEREVLPFFHGLVQMDQVFEKFCKNLTAFLHQNEESALYNVWSGKTMTGKTQVAKRMAGLDGFKPLNLKAIKTFYFDCFYIKDNFEQFRKDLSDRHKFPNNSVIFIDEIEKLLNPDFKIVDDSFVRKFRKLLEDLSSSRKFFMIFLTQVKAQRAEMEKLFDAKLTGFLNYEIQFPDWTKENLVHVIFESFEKKGYAIDDDAAAELAMHSLKNGFIVEIQGVIKLIDIELKHLGQKTVTADLMKTILANRS